MKITEFLEKLNTRAITWRARSLRSARLKQWQQKEQETRKTLAQLVLNNAIRDFAS